jgi:hypothetical protein
LEEQALGYAVALALAAEVVQNLVDEVARAADGTA